MQELIKISQVLIGAETVNSVNVRELYETLEIKKPFTDWIKSQIKTLGLEENMDYITYKQKVKAGRGTTIKTEYIITTDTAKHISMASRTAKGKEVRTYFIAIEKEFIKELQNLQVCQETPYYLKEVDLKDKRVRKAFFKAFDGRCYYSSKKLHIDNFHIDHILPKSRGGQDVLMNLVVCDPAVNISKLNAYDEEFVKKHQAVVKGEPSLKVSVYLTQEKKEVADSVKIALLSKMANFEKMFGTVTARNYFAEMFDVDICKEDFEVTPTQEHIKLFVDEYVEYSEEIYTTVADIYETYKLYADNIGVLPASKIAFFKEFKKLTGLKPYQTRADTTGTRPRVYDVEISF